MDKLNVATANVIFTNNHFPAIRIKYLPDYSHLAQIQSCFKEQGVVFNKKIRIENEAYVKINKCFILEEIDDDIYMDYEQNMKIVTDSGMDLAPSQLEGFDISKIPLKLELDGKTYLSGVDIQPEEFYELLNQIRLNGNCRFFDAAKCGIIVHSEVEEIMRVYSEQLDLTLLKCIQNQINKILKIKLPEYH